MDGGADTWADGWVSGWWEDESIKQLGKEGLWRKHLEKRPRDGSSTVQELSEDDQAGRKRPGDETASRWGLAVESLVSVAEAVSLSVFFPTQENNCAFHPSSQEVVAPG